MNYWTNSKNNIYVAAHRGWCAKYPENTMLAFEKAIELGVDQIETDVRVTRDGELVLIHDATVDRTTNGKGLVSEKLLCELKTLDAGQGEQIPTLRQLMELVKDHPTITLDIELKEYPTSGRDQIAYDVCDRVIAMIEEYSFADRVVFNTFNGKLHEYINAKYGNKYRQHVYYPVCHMGPLTKNPYSYAFCACMFSTVPSPYNMAEKIEFDRMASYGVEPWAGAGVRDEAGVDEMIKCGATLVTCNNPDLILDLLRKKGYHN